MFFGPVPPGQAAGAILAHSVALPGGRLRKGRTLTEGDAAALAAAGLDEVWIARPGPGDVSEDVAAARLGAALLGPGLRAGAAATGRVNLHADGPGVLTYDPEAIHVVNAVDPGITFAVRPPVSRAAAGELVGTVKIIPYAVPDDRLARAEAAAGAAGLTLRGAALRTVALIETTLPGVRTPDPAAVRGRVAALGSTLGAETRVPHAVSALAEAIRSARAEAVLILTASATSDRRDVAPAALIEAGGALTRFGLPADPGNLLFLGDHAGRPVIGLPGCARSPAWNGTDWVLDRVLTGLPCGDAEMVRLGVGGLGKESPARGRPREPRGAGSRGR